ncbi:MAG: hypothetical protein R2710_11850 [Acidimicrobiales bacterium]
MCGRAIHQGDEWRVYLCFHEEEACSSDACEYYKVVPKRVILHELAHPWIEDNIDAETQAAFLELVGLDVWADPDTPGISKPGSTPPRRLPGACSTSPFRCPRSARPTRTRSDSSSSCSPGSNRSSRVGSPRMDDVALVQAATLPAPSACHARGWRRGATRTYAARPLPRNAQP